MKYLFFAFVLLLPSPCLFAQSAVVEVAPAPPSNNIVADSMLMTEVDKMPEFPGGKNGLYSFLSSNLRYPEETRENEMQGKVFVEFVVCEDGSLCNEKIISSFDSNCSKEVLRVVSKMPAWKPAEKDGKKVKTKYRLPVAFQLQTYETEEAKTE